MTSLLDVFMPEDLCARCDDSQPLTKWRVIVLKDDGEKAKLHFCSEDCKQRFVRGWKALKDTQIG